ncbi:hypothetical protein TWF694_001713 [Orbilia ellipsospora]|uniref:Uncharacterized protein n=1 Tax=Orbilia ellipsospora TaxID=2528407 RepID=A0AAV9X3G4_9PEZI
MSSDFSRGVMISLNEHMAQTLLDGMTATIRKETFDLNMQIQGLEMLVESLESLNSQVISFMGELKSNRENTFTYEELDLEGLEWYTGDENGEVPTASPRNYTSRIPSPISNRPALKTRYSSNHLTTLVEETQLSSRRSFETIVDGSDYEIPSKTKSFASSITIKVEEMPDTPPLSERNSSSNNSPEARSGTVFPTKEFRQIDPKKIPKRKPVPSQPQLQLQIPKSNNKAFRRKEVPQRMYESASSGNSSVTLNNMSTTSLVRGNHHSFNKSTDSLWTPPVTDEECSPIRASINSAVHTPTVFYYPKPRRVKSKSLKISIPHRKSSNGKPLRTPSSGSAKYQKRAIEELDRAIVTMRLTADETTLRSASGGSGSGVNTKAVKRMDSGRERRKNSVKRKMSAKRRRRKYEHGIPRCDSPVLGASFDVVFAAPLSRRR